MKDVESEEYARSEGTGEGLLFKQMCGVESAILDNCPL